MSWRHLKFRRLGSATAAAVADAVVAAVAVADAVVAAVAVTDAAFANAVVAAAAVAIATKRCRATCPLPECGKLPKPEPVSTLCIF